MRPSGYLVVPALPLTANGKVDRAALAEHAVPLATRPRTVQAAQAPMERSVAAVWAEVLGHDRFGVQDNFFDIGGHSLLLAKVRERLTPVLGRELAILTLFEHPTVAALARHLTPADDLSTDTPSTLPSDDTAKARLRRGTARLRAMRAQTRQTTDASDGAPRPVGTPGGRTDT